MQTLGTLAADPLASLVDTAYIGHLGECYCLTFRVLAFWQSLTLLRRLSGQLGEALWRVCAANIGAVRLGLVGVTLSVFASAARLTESASSKKYLFDICAKA